MDKKVIIRGAAIVVAGIAISTYGAQLLFPRDAGDMPHSADVGQAASPASELAETEGLTIDDTQMTAFASDTVSAVNPVASEGRTSDRNVPGCQPRLSATAAIDALIELVLEAPCHPNERVVVSHADLAFSSQTNAAGRYSTFLPALTADARVDVFLGSDTFLEARVALSDIDAYFRVVAQWNGDLDLGLHGFHRGAEFGQEGHLHARNPFDHSAEDAFLITLGDREGADPMMAEVYSIPVALMPSSRVELALSFDDAICGQVVSAYIFESDAGRISNVKEAQFVTPDCPTGPGLLVMALPFLSGQKAELVSH